MSFKQNKTEVDYVILWPMHFRVPILSGILPSLSTILNLVIHCFIFTFIYIKPKETIIIYGVVSLQHSVQTSILSDILDWNLHIA